jgi:putative phosphoribosyl transferase
VPSTKVHHRRVFRDREEAGERLAESLAGRFAGERVVVLGIPRGGVVVAAPIAEVMHAQLDVVVPRKLGAPGNPELAIGAIAPGVRVLDERLLRSLGVADWYVEQEIVRAEEEIRRRTERYRSGRAAVAIEGAMAVIVDDGVATGATAVAALRWARAQGAARVALAAPVGPRGTIHRLALEADEVVVMATPLSFVAVGEWYLSFDQVSDDEVIRALGGRA